MILNRVLLKDNVPTKFSDTIDYSDNPFDPNHIRAVKNCKVEIEATDFGEIVSVNFSITADVTAVCAYTLEDVILPTKVNDSLYFSNDESDEDAIYMPSDQIDLDPVVLALILARVPIRVIKKGAKLPSGGEGYRVMTEDELKAERAKKTDPRWSALDNIEIDED